MLEQVSVLFLSVPKSCLRQLEAENGYSVLGEARSVLSAWLSLLWAMSGANG